MSTLLDNALIEKRQVIYASLMRYAPEAASLRERLLDRLVLASLIGSTRDNAFRIGQIQSNLLFAPGIPRIRDQVIQESLTRLMNEHKVERIEPKKRHAYYLTEAAVTDVNDLVNSGEDLFTPVLDRMTENTSHLIPKEMSTLICRSFICQCFARFGADIAKTVVGELACADLIEPAHIELAFEAATLAHNLQPEAGESLKSRCQQFLSSQHPQDVQLRFHLTQGFYFAQLLGLPGTSFNPLGEQAFAGCVLYLDTNVLLVGLLAPDLGVELFREMVAISKRIGTSLRVTRATINEARRVAVDRLAILTQILEKLPTEVIHRTNDQFITAFLSARETQHDLTPKAFLDPFDHLSDILATNWGIEIDERIEEEMLANESFSDVASVFQESALRTRKFEKSEAILKHDVSHYALIKSERNTKPQTWFLTRDRSLAQAALQLRRDAEQPFCFSLIGFLQAISPFVRSDGPENKFADIFSLLMEGNSLPTEAVFSAREFLLLVEMHQDVLSTPKESLIQALDYVKTVVLRGEPYKSQDCNKVSLGLKSYLVSSGDERRKELERQVSAAEKEATAAKSLAVSGQQRVKVLEGELGTKDATISNLENTSASMQQKLQQAETTQSRSRFGFALIGIVSATIWWATNDLLSQELIHIFPSMEPRIWWTRETLGVLGVLMFVIPGLYFVSKTKWGYKLRYGAAFILIGLALAASRIIGSGTWHSTGTGIIEVLFAALSWLVTPRPRDASRIDPGR